MARRKRLSPRTNPKVQRNQQKLGEIEKLLDGNAVFSMRTFDDSHWIDPSTGALILSPYDWQDTAREHLQRFDHWKNRSLKALNELHEIRWLHWLQNHIRDDDRLHLFDDNGRWLNPLNARWSAQVQRENGRITLHCLRQMAAELSRDIDSEPDHLQPLALLLRLRDQARRLGSDQRPSTVFKISAFESSHAMMTADSTTEVPSVQQESDLVETAGTADLKALEQGPGLAELEALHAELLQAPMAIPNFEHALVSRPKDSVGGDFYDMQPLSDGRYFLIVGDVSGHGSEAARVVVSAMQVLRKICEESTQPELIDILVRFNDGLRENLDPGQYCTCFAATIDPQDGTITSACAGHHPAVIGNTMGRVIMRQLGLHGMAIGLRDGTALAGTLQIEKQRLARGDTIFLYTDGLCEATNPRGAQLGHWGAYAAFTGNLKGDCNRIVNNILLQIHEFAQHGLEDDITLLALRFQGN